MTAPTLLEAPHDWLAPEVPQPKPLEMKVGFTVGLYENGDLLFKIHGSAPGAIELRGLVDFARQYVEYNLKTNKVPSVEKDILREIQAIKDHLNISQ